MGRDHRGSAASLVVSTHDYFNEIVTDAFDRRKIVTLAPVRGYIVDLLEFYVPAANLFDEVDSSGRRTRETLAETYLRAQTAEPLVRIELLKKLGDRSLYISGFFADSLQRKLIDVDYYIDMGGAAYGRLSDNVRGTSQGRAFGSVFAELAEKFRDFVDVLAEIRDSGRAAAIDVLRLYEVWLRTGSRRAARLLREHGLEPNATLNVTTRH